MPGWSNLVTAVAPSYENQGLATEAARGLIEKAFADEHVQMVDAHTLAEWNASTKNLTEMRAYKDRRKTRSRGRRHLALAINA